VHVRARPRRSDNRIAESGEDTVRHARSREGRVEPSIAAAVAAIACVARVLRWRPDMHRSVVGSLVVLAFAAACGGVAVEASDAGAPEGGADARAAVDAGAAVDAAHADAAVGDHDAGPADTGGQEDAGPNDPSCPS